jgi:hypothetical protein
MWYHYCDKNNHKADDCRSIAKFKQQENNWACFEAKDGPGKKTLAFPFEEINALKRPLKPEKTASSKKRKAEFIHSTETNINTSSDEGEEYLFTSSKPFSYNKTKLEKSSHPITELVVSVIVNNEEHLLRALSDTGASSSIILEAYTLTKSLFIKTDDSNTTTWSTMGDKFTTTKTRICL